MSKRILSLALAVVMLVSVFAFSANAAVTVDTVFPAAGQAGYRVVSDAYVGMPAGETVTVKVYFEFPDGTNYDELMVAFAGNTYLCYTDAFTVDTSSRVFGDSYWYMKGTINNKATLFTTVSEKFNAADKAMGWTQCVMVQKTVDTTLESGYTTKTGHPVDPYCELYSIEFETTRTLTAADTIGIPSGCANAKSTTGTVAIGTVAPSKVSLAAEDIIFSEATAKADYVDVNDTATAKMRYTTGSTTKVDLGCTGSVKSAAFKSLCPGGLTWDESGWISNEVKAVSVQFRVNGVVEEATTNTIYVDEAGNFKFRAAVTGIDKAGLSEMVEVRMVANINGTPYYSNWMAISVDAVHTNAVANSNGEFAGI